MPSFAVRHHQLCRAYQARHANVVAAVMHDWSRYSRCCRVSHVAGKWHAGVLFYWQSVELGAQQNSVAWPVFQYADDTGSADRSSDLVTHGLEMLGKLRSGVILVHRELWRLMQVDI